LGLFLLFVGVLAFIHGVYREKVHQLSKQEKVVVRFIPRDAYENMVFSGVVNDPYITDDMWLSTQGGGGRPAMSPWVDEKRDDDKPGGDM